MAAVGFIFVAYKALPKILLLITGIAAISQTGDGRRGGGPLDVVFWCFVRELSHIENRALVPVLWLNQVPGGAARRAWPNGLPG